MGKNFFLNDPKNSNNNTAKNAITNLSDQFTKEVAKNALFRGTEVANAQQEQLMEAVEKRSKEDYSFNEVELKMLRTQLNEWMNDTSNIEKINKKYKFIKGVVLVEPFYANLSKNKDVDFIGLDGKSVTEKLNTYMFNFWKIIAIAVDIEELKPSMKKIDLKPGQYVVLEDELFKPQFIEDYKMPVGNQRDGRARPLINEDPLNRLNPFFFTENKFSRDPRESADMYLIPSDFIRGVHTKNFKI